MKIRLVVLMTCCGGLVLTLLTAQYAVSNQAEFVGSKACSECHEEQYENFHKFAKKSHSDKSVRLMSSDLKADEIKECYGCHTTGYGQPGGFVSYEETPELGHAGCEVCHGPGSEHIAEGGDTDLIKGDLSLEDCTTCHNAERVGAFNFKPLLYGGAH